MKRDQHRRIAYGLRRMSRAIDRFIIANTMQEKAQARAWSLAWAKVAKVAPHGR